MEFFWSVFSRIWIEYRDLLNTEIYSVNLSVQSKYGKIRNGKNSVFGHFSRNKSVKYTLNVV